MNQSNFPADQLFEQLTRLVQAIDAAGKAILPRSDQELLQSIVDAAARIFGAAAASISLVDEQRQMLEFRVAYGAGNKELVGMRIPIDKGIAGYVALTGQPIAISDVRKDPRFNQEFAKSTGYVPSSILATPLLFEERVIGVMEVLDKIERAVLRSAGHGVARDLRPPGSARHPPVAASPGLKRSAGARSERVSPGRQK